jgi:hypothetical protein
MTKRLFVSYANPDKTIAKKVVEALSLYGYDIFWDTNVPTGQTFDTYIHANLTQSDAVIVLWSRHSVVSNYVKEEAEYAKKKGILIPLRIDETDFPFGFSRLQTTDIIGWSGSIQEPVWRHVIGSIQETLERKNNVGHDVLERPDSLREVKASSLGLQVNASTTFAIALIILMLVLILGGLVVRSL